MLQSRLCGYSDAYILVKVTMSIAEGSDANNTNKRVILKNLDH